MPRSLARIYHTNADMPTVGDRLTMRVAVHVALIALLLLAPWWLFLLAAIGAVLLLPFFVEVVLYGLLVDVLFAPPDLSLGFAFATTVLLLGVFIIIEYTKTRLR